MYWMLTRSYMIWRQKKSYCSHFAFPAPSRVHNPQRVLSAHWMKISQLMELYNFQSGFRHTISYNPVIVLWCLYNVPIRIDSKGEMTSKSQKFWRQIFLIANSVNWQCLSNGVCFVWMCDVCVSLCVCIPVCECTRMHATAPMWRSDGNLTTSNVSPHIPPCLRHDLLAFCHLGQVYRPMSFLQFSFCLPSPCGSVLGSLMFMVCIQLLCRLWSFNWNPDMW